jgi:hypothetical protein
MTEMLQKTENVANNVVNENSQDLTEQWKKGELPSGWGRRCAGRRSSSRGWPPYETNSRLGVP